MKRLCALLTALALMLAAAGAAAETQVQADLCELYDVGGEENRWIGTAIPVMDGVALTVLPGAEKLQTPVLWDGTDVYPASVYPVLDGRMAVILFNTDGQTVPPFPFVESGREMNTADLRVRSGDELFSRINRAVYDAARIRWNEMDCYIMTLSGDTAIGSPLLTLDGELAGIIAAEYAEGKNRYVALTIPEITRGIVEAAEKLDQPLAVNGPEGYEVTLDGNMVTFDWMDVELPELKKGEALYHIVADTESTYLTYLRVQPGVTRTSLLLTPGRMYASGLAVIPDDRRPDSLPEKCVLTSLPQAEPMTEHGFKSLVCAIAELPADAPDGEMPVPAEKVTEELLRSGRACFYSVTSYDVQEEIQDLTLLVTLTAPDGNNYRYVSGWYYDPKIREKDEWYVKMDDTGLLAMLNEGEYPDGIYEVNMFIDGKLADSFSFELIK